MDSFPGSQLKSLCEIRCCVFILKTIVILHDQLTRLVLVMEMESIRPAIASIMVGDDQNIIQIARFHLHLIAAFITVPVGKIVDVSLVEVYDPIDVIAWTPVHIGEYAGVSKFGSFIVICRIADQAWFIWRC